MIRNLLLSALMIVSFNAYTQSTKDSIGKGVGTIRVVNDNIIYGRTKGAFEVMP
jgi:hypothetical protein